MVTRMGNPPLSPRTATSTPARIPCAPQPSGRALRALGPARPGTAPGACRQPAFSASCPRLVAICAALLLAAGCAGYQIGNASLYPPEIRSVAVPVFESDSFRRGLGERLTEAVVKQIESVTPYKVVQGPSADSTLWGRIVGENKRVLIGSRSGEPRELEMDLRVEVSWVDHRGNLIRPTSYVALPPELVDVAATGNVIPELGHSVGTAHQQAISRLAEQIVSLMETPW